MIRIRVIIQNSNYYFNITTYKRYFSTNLHNIVMSRKLC